ncbi:MAG: hypothetical protein GXP61_09510 [Epsilonproteobacteria bacterium]|nr:hypothetical protein [Campylobacterota bacterium]
MFKITVSLFILLSFLVAGNSCATCHPKASKNCQKSIHYTLKKAINITRVAWGIKDSNVTIQTLPLPKKEIKKPSDLVDDFLRRKCLKCHLGNKSSGEKGMNRGTSCLACHSPHQKNGKCQRKKISMSKCLSCHNKEFVGGDYLGLFPKDYDKSYRAPLTKDGRYPPRKYGIDFHHLSSDIHFQKGMSCVDCHKKDDMQGIKKVSCTDCHKKLSKKNHTSFHKKLACSTCHSSWNINSYELSVFRDDTNDYKKWRNLTLQEDGYLTNFLTKALRSKKKIPPKMPDWITHKFQDGIWYSGYRYRRWEHFNLANSKDGRIMIVRPLFQYRISYRDKNGKMILDDVSKIDGKKIEVWLPYSPHTISKNAKSCESCHNNPLIINPQKTGYEALDLQIPNNIVDGYKLTKEQIKKMTSKKYKKIRAKILFYK